ncbi:MauE/DoxX family redox-associated membrane protein [Janibacter massiliensis]|uniref:MauE/DoxX family redox-associated membrane protein n=1 Tax=Janibacter massiliensis TaxID=2058291 RepID=UPI00131A5806|nr:MauE/DoxX family redox-associated membrane protein [Janibacter massiliensis]
MTPALVLAPLAIAGVLLVSAVAKLRAPAATRSAFSQLRLPRWLERIGAPRILPWGELVLALALLLLPGWAGVAAAAAVFVLMLVYLAVIVRALGFDHPVTCGCFGQLGMGTVTRRTAWRNAALVVVAGLALWLSVAGSSPLQRVLDGGWSSAWWVVGAAAVALLTRLVLDAPGAAPSRPIEPARSAVAPPRVDEDDLDYVREPIPHGVLVDEDGTFVALRQLPLAAAQLLVMVNPGCGPCGQVATRVPTWVEQLGPVELKIVVTTPVADAVERHPELAGRTLRDPQGQVTAGFRIAAPGAVLLGADGLLAGGPVVGLSEVEEFVADIVEAVSPGP